MGHGGSVHATFASLSRSPLRSSRLDICAFPYCVSRGFHALAAPFEPPGSSDRPPPTDLMAPKDPPSSPSEVTPLVRGSASGSVGGGIGGYDARELPPPRSPLHKAPTWQFWQTTSPSHRFFLLLLMSCIPFGGHFVKVSHSCFRLLGRGWRGRGRQARRRSIDGSLIDRRPFAPTAVCLCV